MFEPSAPFQDNWHIGAGCEALEAVSRGEIKDLVINQPPGTTKSSLVSVAWNAWGWIDKPGDRWMYVSGDGGLVLRDANKVVSVISSELYQAAFPHAARLRTNAPAGGDFWTTAGGQRFSTSVQGRAIGQHAHKQVWDDPIKPDALRANPQEALAKCYDAFTGTFSQRKADPETFARVLIMQRLRDGDLSDKMLESGAEHIMFPMRYVPNCQWDMGNSLGIEDPRTEEGELLMPSRFSEAVVRASELELGNDSSAQLQQNPTPATGGFIEEAWVQLEWIELPDNPQYYQSWDFSSGGKDPKVHSRVHGALWCVGQLTHARRLCTPLDKVLKGVVPEYEPVAFEENRIVYCLVDEVIGHMNYPESKRAFIDAQKRPKWSRCATRIIEKKANGVGLIDELDSQFSITAISPKDPKEVRVRVESAKFENGQVLHPPVGRMAATFEARSELVKFPRGTYDDRADTATQLLAHVGDKLERYKESMRQAQKENTRRRR